MFTQPEYKSTWGGGSSE